MTNFYNEPFESIFQSSTLIDLLRWRALQQPNNKVYTFLVDGETEEIHLTYGELYEKSKNLAIKLQNTGKIGERVLLIYSPGLDYIIAFYGCILAGLIAVPIYPPRSNSKLFRLQNIVVDSHASIALTTNEILLRIERQLFHTPELQNLTWLATDNIRSDIFDEWKKPNIDGESLAFLQYTSGSTGMPKGVMVSHNNLLHNERIIQSAFQHTENSTVVSWLPIYHDMGLIGSVIQPLYIGSSCVLMSPIAFLQHPIRWLKAISRYKAHTSGAPNFAYDLCVRNVTPDDRTILDLSSWKIAFNGSESIHYKTMERFALTFESSGFLCEAFYPCYGLAEATLFVSGGQKTVLPTVYSINKTDLEQNQVLLGSMEGRETKILVSCGQTWSDSQIVIVDPKSLTKCSSEQIGEIWISGQSVAKGYWNQPEETEKVFHAYLKDSKEGYFLRTGDLGFIKDGELFVTGRLKDLIIIRGRNYYPQDIELTVEKSDSAIKENSGAAFAVDVDEEERLIVVYEIKRSYLKNIDIEKVIEKIRIAVAEEYALQVYGVLLIKTGSILKTSSGKIQRQACKDAFLTGNLDIIGSSLLENYKLLQIEETLNREILLAIAPADRLFRLESYLKKVIAQVLKLDISLFQIQQSLAYLGIDSLSAIEIVYRIKTDLDIDLSLTTLLQDYSINLLASEILTQLITVSKYHEIESIPQSKLITEHSLSYGQQALWYIYHTNPNSVAYNIMYAAKINSELDNKVLKRAFQFLIDRHPSLRTTYHNKEGKPVAKVHKDIQIYFKEIDEATISNAKFQKQLLEEADRPFDLAKPPLIRLHLFNHSCSKNTLLLTAHHIAIDFWSLDILLDELCNLYNAELENSDLSTFLPLLNIQYADYVNWQTEILSKSEGERLWRYWQKQLSGDLPVLNLPTDHPRTPIQTYHGASHTFYLDETLTNKLKQLAKAQKTTPYTILLAAFQILLHYYTGQDEIFVGSPMSGRNKAEFREVIGYFVNPVVVKANLADNPSIQELLIQLRQTILEAIDHQDYPFPLLVEKLQPTRDASRSPIFQVSFTLVKSRCYEQQKSSPFFATKNKNKTIKNRLEMIPVEMGQRGAPFDLDVIVMESSNSLLGIWQYNSDLFDRSTIIRMIEHFSNLLQNIVDNPNQHLSELSILTVTEQQQILIDWNNTKVNYSQDKCIHQLFEDQVKRTPDAVAVIFEKKQLTYRELNNKANQLAHHLHTLGVKPEVLVGIYVDRSLEMVEGILGILKAGGAYVPLDPSYPKERLAFMLEDSQVSVILTQRNLLDQLPTNHAQIFCLDTDRTQISKYSQETPECVIVPENLAYVIYTSGSTGKPKGAMNTHQGVVNRLLWMQDTYQLTASDKVLQKTPFSFDVSVWEFFWVLLTGGCLIIAKPGGHQDSSYLVNLIAQEQITTLHFVPSMLKIFLEEQELAKCHSLKRVFCSGEALSWKLQQRFFERLGCECELHNLYGPTEAAIDVTYWQCLCNSKLEKVPIGRPVANTQLYILDRNLQPVPIGVSGELHIAGIQLARGYLNRPELTAEKFIDNPFSNLKTNSKLYKTGDLVKYLPDGNIEYIGRIDDQVKIRGFRIELGEIENVLLQHSNVRETVVVVKDINNDKQLLAYLVQNQEGLSIAEIKNFIKKQLPDYMIPSAFIILDAFPLTCNGKVDKSSLPNPEVFGSYLKRVYVSPRTPTEEILASIWAELLRLEKIGIYDNFFDLGGHSLLGTQLISRIRNTFSIELSIRCLFESPTIAAISEKICSLRNHNLSIPPIQKVASDHQHPLSFAQQRLWFLNQLEGNSGTYNMPIALRLAGVINLPALEQSFTEIVKRHEILRTSFPLVNGLPSQVITPILKVKLVVVNLQSLSEIEQLTEIQRLAEEEARKPFNLEKLPLMRTTLLHLGKDDYVLLLTIHHIIFDGWSVGIFVRELSSLYTAFSQNEPSPLSELQIQYADFSHWQHRWLTKEFLKNQQQYWQHQLAEIPKILQLPTDHPRPAVQTFRGNTQAFYINSNVKKSLKKLSQQTGVTLFMTVLTAFAILLSRYSHQEDIVIGSPIANRNRKETEPLIGFFVNTLPLRINLSDDPTFQDLLFKVRQITLEAYEHQDLPFEKIVEDLQIERSLSYTPLFQVMFVWQNMPIFEDLQLLGLEITHLATNTVTAKFDLTLYMEETESQLQGKLEYNTDLFNSDIITRIVVHFQTLLEDIVESNQKPISQLSLLTQLEKEQLLINCNKHQFEYPQSKSIHQVFEEQVAKTPEAIAVVFEEQQLTYKELNEKANQLAHYLQSLGVKVETLVGICIERSLDMVIGILGILKAGGAYVPLDPSYPDDRLTFMLQDAQVSVLLTQECLVGKLFQSQARIVCLDKNWAEITQQSGSNLKNEVFSENLAYVIYTSGSTGKPKGVLVSHFNVVRLFTYTESWFNFNDNDVWTLFHSYAFDFSVWELWGALLYGGRLVVVPYWVSRSPEAFYKLLCREQVTVLNQTPSAFGQLIKAEEVLGVSKELALRYIIFGGEAIEFQRLKTWFNHHGDKQPQLINMYGITETTVHVTYRPLTISDLDNNSCVIGSPIPDMQVYLLDKYLQPVPIGIPGEMYIGGGGLTKGYLNRPQLTSERFISNPLIPNSKGYLYKTGDMARYLNNVDIEYLGRIDYQVKIRGFRIELGEIQAALNQHPNVQDVVVIAYEHQSDDKRLVAYIVPEHNQQLISSELRLFLNKKLPEYMIPSAFIFLHYLPLTSNGKLDRQALPTLEDQYNKLEIDSIKPRTPIEELLLGIWTQVLNIGKISCQDNFFELGGHSLLATQVISRIRDTFNLEIPLRQLFENPTITSFAESIESLVQGKNQFIESQLKPISREDELPLSFAQYRLWLMDKLNPCSPLYNISFAVRVKGFLKITVLEQSFNEIISRHEILRTNFKMVEGKPLQVITSPFYFKLVLVDIRDIVEYERETKFQELANKETQTPFDITQCPLLRVSVFQLDESDYIVLMTVHHIIFDGWSISVLLKELSAIYNSLNDEQSSLLSELNIQYADFAYWQRQWFQGKVLQKQLSYWKKQLGGSLSILQLPTVSIRPPVQTFRGSHEYFLLNNNLTKSLIDLSEHEGVTLFMLLLAAFKALLYRYTSQQDICVGTPIANRNRSDIENLIGFFVNTIVIRSNLSDNLTFRELVIRMRKLTLEAYANQDLPFEMLVEELQPERNLSYHPIFQVMFVLQNTPKTSLELSGLKLEPIPLENKIAKFDLTLLMEDTEQGLKGTLEYNTDLFDTTSIKRMIGHFETLLKGIVGSPDLKLSELPILTDSERNQLLIKWNKLEGATSLSTIPTQGDSSRDQCIHQLFEEQVAKTPDAIAVVFENQYFTYRELNNRANQLANYLQSLGIKAETLVGLLIESSLEMVVGILGIIKAGGAYVPLDPSYPKKRLAFMLEDSKTDLLLTQQHLLKEIPYYSGNKVCLDSDWKLITSPKKYEHSSINYPSRVKQENLAYVIYTSGSTGKPKGVLISHRSLVNSTIARFQYYSERVNSFLLLSSFAFDSSIAGIFWTLTQGGQIVLPNSKLLAFNVSRLIKEHNISHLLCVPSLYTLILEQTKTNDFNSLKTVILAGEVCSKQIVKKHRQVMSDTSLFNEYGPTENTVWSSVYDCKNLDLETKDTKVPIGRPILNTKIYLLDKNLLPVPIGIPGELYIGGLGVARGYLNRPELTLEKFIPNPFNAKSEDRLYKTGDLARYLSDGNLEFIGRCDEQIKLRGFRIELGEIETLLQKHSAVKETVVLTRNTELGQQLLAYVVLKHEQTSKPKELKDFLSEQLPNYMIPSYFIFLEEIPLTPNGKKDRIKLLSYPVVLDSDIDDGYIQPQNQVEKRIAGICEEILSVNKLSINDNFFDLGGNSLLLIQVHNRLEEIFDLKISITELFRKPTIQSWANLIKQKDTQNFNHQKRKSRAKLRIQRRLRKNQ